MLNDESDMDDLLGDFETLEFQVLLTIKSVVRPAFYLPKAIESLESVGTVQAVSSVWETTSNQVETEMFCTVAVALLTPLDPLELRQSLDAVERHLGNARGLDESGSDEMLATAQFEIAMFEDLEVDFETSPIPMSNLSEKPAYVLPLAEIAPEFEVPNQNGTLQALAERSAKTDFTRLSESIKLKPSQEI